VNYSPTAKQAAPAPRIRYLSSPPEEITVCLGELKLPERLKSSGFDPSRSISLRCSEVFAGPQPSIDVARLAELAPQDIAPDFLQSGSIPINAAMLALRFKFFESVEHLEDTAMTPVATLAVEAPAPESLPVDPARVDQPDGVSNSVETPAPPVKASSSPAREPELRGVVEAPVLEAVSSPLDIPPPAPPTGLPEPSPAAPPEPEMVSIPPLTVPLPPPPPPARESGAPDSKSAPRPRPAARIPDKRTIFNILPALRRQNPIPKPAAPVVDDLAPEPAERIPETTVEPPAKPSEVFPLPPMAASAQESGLPQTFSDVAPLDDAEQEPAPWEVPIKSSVPAPTPDLPPPPPAVEPPAPAAFHIEHLPPSMLNPVRVVAGELESAPDERLSAQDRLQEIFMTEDQLTLAQVLKLCGGLPGIRSCILTKGSSVLATFNVPDAIDLVSLTGNASAMLDAMRASSMRMGLGAIPAVTVHSEKGPISFFHSDDLAMLIIHADRGFIPGVREKLHDVVVALNQSNLPLPLGDPSEK
jgi:hypothetical protein